MNYSIDTINPCGEMSDKDIKNQKIVDLASPIDHQDEANKKYADKKETINLINFHFFCQNMKTEIFLLRHSSGKKQRHTDHNLNSKATIVLQVMINQD